MVEIVLGVKEERSREEMRLVEKTASVMSSQSRDRKKAD